MLASDADDPALTHPLAWPWALESSPALTSEATPWRAAVLRRWHGTSPVMVQPPLDQHYLVMHLGGAKHVRRRGDGPEVSTIVDSESLTLVPAGSSYVWRTQGPIAFAHLYLPPRLIEAALEEHGRGAGPSLALVDRVGCRDACLEPLLKSMMAEIGQGVAANRLRLDALFEQVCIRLGERHSSQRPSARTGAVALAPHRLRHVLDYLDAHFADDVTLADLAAAAGSSQSHFSRAFRIATGRSPYRYLLERRIEHAKVLLLTSDLPLDAIGARCGFHSRHQFSLIFKQLAGIGPKRFSAARRGRTKG